MIAELKRLKVVYEPWFKLNNQARELDELLQMVEDGDQESLKSIEADIRQLVKETDDLEFKSLLSGEDDPRGAILSINSGAGGTEACDWAAMLLRMYTRWSESKGYQVQRVDFLPGEEAGIKNATYIIRGPFAYGYLKSENGVHRLVRISPFDSSRRRHTSFASVDVIPEVDDSIKIEIDEKDLRVDTYRSSGKGGQHVDVTDSAVRITHIPSGIVTQCQNERSQYKNKSMAMKVLKAKLYEAEREKKKKEIEHRHGQKERIEWGSQIRSYVMHPYSMVKDHRTKRETSDVQGVMDGDIDDFMEAFLKRR